MAVRQDKVQVSVEINGQKAGKTLGELTRQTQQLNRELNHLTPGTEEFNQKAEELRSAKARLTEIRNEVNGTEQALQGMNLSAVKAGLAMGAAFVVAKVVEFGRHLVGLATEIEGVQAKFNTVFGASAQVVDEAARKNATSIGLTRNEFKGLAADAGDLLIPMGFLRSEAANMSAGIVQLSGALSEWSAGQHSTEEAAQILTKAMLGERDGLKSLGISISEADIQQKLLERGQKNLTGQLLEQAKAIATYDLILAKSKDAQDAFASNSDKLSRQFSTMKASVNTMVDNLAERFTPAISKAVSWITGLVKSVSDYAEIRFREKLIQEQASVNGLVSAIIQHNEKNELRTRLVNELQAKYPSFLENLDKEKVTNEQLKDRLFEVNQEYTKKIAISAQEEIINDLLEEQKGKIVEMAEVQKELGRRIFEANQRGANIDIGAPLDKQILDLKKFAESYRLSAKNAIDGATFYNQIYGRAAHNFETLASTFKDYSKINSQVGQETENFNLLLKRLGIELGQVDQIMGRTTEAELAAAERLRKEREAQEAAGEAARKKAEEDRKKAAEEAKKHQEQLIKDAASAAKTIEDLKLQMIEDPFKREEAQIRLNTQRKISALVGSPEQVQEQTKLLNDAMFNALQELNIKQSEAVAAEEAERAKHDAESLQSQLGRMEVAEQQELLQLELKFSKEVDMQAEFERQQFELRQQALDARYQLLVQNGEGESELARKIEAEKLKNQIDFNKKRVENEKRTAQLREQMSKQTLGFISDAIDIGIDLLSQDEKARKKNASLIKAFSAGKIMVDLAMEIGGYMASPSSVASGGISGAILSALATARAALAVSKVMKQEFAFGGLIPGTKFSAGIPSGPSHSGGGIALTDRRTGLPIGEMEGGEPIMILSKRTYANNGPIIDRLLYSSLYREGAPIFANGTMISAPNNTSIQVREGDAGSASSQQLGQLIAEVGGLRQDIANWQNVLRAYVVFTDLEEAQATSTQIFNDSKIG
jgi:uncharacterized protein YoxC